MANQDTRPVVKYLLFVFNFLFWIFGIALLAIGIWALVERESETSINSHVDFFTDPAIVLIVVGVVAFILGFSGCIGAIRENCVLLTIFYLLLLLLFVLEVMAGVLVFIYSDEFEQEANDIVETAIMRYRQSGYEDLTNFIDFSQRTFECCGGEKSYQDWTKNKYFNCTPDNPSRERCGVPYSCCIQTDEDIINTQCGYNTQELAAVTANDKIYVVGCVEALLDNIKTKSYIVGVTVIMVAAFQITGIVLAYVLCREIENEKERYNRSARARLS
ncbi:tetraspanin-33-like isoform X1 [Anneissia japonica]|uniref:tetraspanin-33-like isoform X1 n=1 Tax=Anneissia japonica TaxID=1529436 RepID=UPI0014258C51|nr:tetraspanin-33-like isoform X1 [Anneissia japonica]